MIAKRLINGRLVVRHVVEGAAHALGAIAVYSIGIVLLIRFYLKKKEESMADAIARAMVMRVGVAAGPVVSNSLSPQTPE